VDLLEKHSGMTISPNATQGPGRGLPDLPEGHTPDRVVTNKSKTFVASKEGGYFTWAGAKWVQLTFQPAALK
jgi:hypothetical protein